MTVSPNTIRQRIASSIDGVTGWRETVDMSSFIGGADSGSAGKVFAVSVPRSEIVDPRQRRSAQATDGDGVRTATTVRVRLLQRIKADDQVGSYDAAVAAEDGIQAAIAAGTWTGTTPIVWSEITREEAGDGTFLLTTLIGVVHHMS